MWKTVLKALGLSETATEAEVLQAVQALQQDRQSLVALSGRTTVAEALGVLTAHKGAADQVQALQARITELEGKERDTEVLSLIEQGKKDGKITPAMVESLTAMGNKDVATLKAFLEVAPKVAPDQGGHTPPETPAGGPVTLSAEEKAVCAQLGVDPAALHKHKQGQQA